jgi:hypothetical protein
MTKSVLLAGIVTGGFLVSSATFAQSAAATPTPAVKTMPANATPATGVKMTPATSTPATASTANTVKINETCKKEHPDLNGQAYKDCVKNADKVKMH